MHGDMLSPNRTDRITNTARTVLHGVGIYGSRKLGLFLLSRGDDRIYECTLWIMVVTRCIGKMSAVGQPVLFTRFRAVVTYRTFLQYGGTVEWISVDCCHVASTTIPFRKLGHTCGIDWAFLSLRLFVGFIQLVDILFPLYICNFYIDRPIFIHPSHPSTNIATGM